MIACFSKNARAARLFKELKNIDPEFKDLGVARPSFGSKCLSAAVSVHCNWLKMRADAGFSPIMAAEMERRGSKLLGKCSGARAILYWGAMNFPVCASDLKIPYFIITDGPFDPEETSYPVGWAPIRWRESYLQRQKSVYGEAAQVFTMSDWARNKIISIHGLDPAQVTRIGWGPMHHFDGPILDPSAPSRFVSLGNFWEIKGMDIVAKATEMLRKKRPEVLTIIAGKSLGLSIRPAPGLDLRPTLISGGEAQQLIAHSRALIVASRFEFASHVIYEALQAGTPVIGSDICAIPEAINAPDGGLLVPPENPEALADAMERILSQGIPSQRKAAFSVYERSGGWKRCAEIVRQKILLTLRLRSA